MPVGQKQAIAFAKHLLPGRGHWKTKQHLIHFAVAVAANSNNAFRHAVKPLRHLTRRIPLRQRVARTVIEHIAEYDQPPGAALREPFKHAFRGGQRTMNIGGKHQLHRFHLHWLRCLYDSGSAAGYQPQRLAESAT